MKRAATILIVGGGSIGERHLRCFQQVGCDVALCETDDARRAEIASRYQLAQSYAAIEAASARSWDGVVICTPAHCHVEHAIQLAQSTLALLIEKPLCTRWEEVNRLKAATAGKVVQVAYVLRTHPATARVRELLAAGRNCKLDAQASASDVSQCARLRVELVRGQPWETIGDLHQVTIVAGQHFPTFRPAYRQIYYARRETGGGAVQDAATHLFDLVQHLAGPFSWIFCDAAHMQLPGVEVEDTVHLVGRTGSGRVLVSLALNQFMAPNETVVQLNGSQGSVQVRYHEHRMGLLRLGDSDWSWSEPLVHDRDELFRAQARSFLAAAAGEQPPLCTLDEAAHTLRVNLAALESAELGVKVKLDGA